MAVTWQDIATAPRDGTHVLVHRLEWPRARVMLWGFHAHVGHACWNWPYDENVEQPTHWLTAVPALANPEAGRGS